MVWHSQMDLPIQYRMTTGKEQAGLLVYIASQQGHVDKRSGPMVGDMQHLSGLFEGRLHYLGGPTRMCQEIIHNVQLGLPRCLLQRTHRSVDGFGKKGATYRPERVLQEILVTYKLDQPVHFVQQLQYAGGGVMCEWTADAFWQKGNVAGAAVYRQAHECILLSSGSIQLIYSMVEDVGDTQQHQGSRNRTVRQQQIIHREQRMICIIIRKKAVACKLTVTLVAHRQCDDMADRNKISVRIVWTEGEDECKMCSGEPLSAQAMMQSVNACLPVNMEANTGSREKDEQVEKGKDLPVSSIMTLTNWLVPSGGRKRPQAFTNTLHHHRVHMSTIHKANFIIQEVEFQAKGVHRDSQMPTCTQGNSATATLHAVPKIQHVHLQEELAEPWQQQHKIQNEQKALQDAVNEAVECCELVERSARDLHEAWGHGNPPAF
ncbi:hypothetical protein HD554DRAFT_2038919 [Boletus coccyginus]|nr:hypothetical protein HD554DRAFT_2038919 [Boletus coccyginus]